MSLERVLVVGTSCAGKSRFSASLAAALGQPYTELDALHWAADWQIAPDFVERTSQAAAQPRWVIDGNYGAVREVLWPRATTVVWLNYSFPVVMWRAIRRTVHRAATNAPLWNGNRETIRISFFSRESILWWVITTFHSRQRELGALRASGQYAQLDWIEFTRPEEAERYLLGLKST